MASNAVTASVSPVPSWSPMERVNIAGMDVLINPTGMTYTINTRYQQIETQGGVVVQFGPEHPVALDWTGKTTKDALGTIARLHDIWRAQQYGRQSVRYVNPMRGEDYEVAILSVSHNEDVMSPWRYDYQISFLILQDYSKASLHSAMPNYNLGNQDFGAATAMILGDTQSYTASDGETFQDISQKTFGTAAFAGTIRNFVAASNPSAVSPTGEPIPGIRLTIPITINETNYSTTSVADYFSTTQGGSSMDKEAQAVQAVTTGVSSAITQHGGVSGRPQVPSPADYYSNTG